MAPTTERRTRAEPWTAPAGATKRPRDERDVRQDADEQEGLDATGRRCDYLRDYERLERAIFGEQPRWREPR